MNKMLKLIQNEYIKTLKKVSTKIVFILILLLAVGLVVIAKIADRDYDYDDYGYYDPIADYQWNLDHVNEVKAPGYEQEAEMYQFMIDNKIIDDWKAEACYDAFETHIEYTDETGENAEVSYLRSEEERNKIKQFVTSSDWKGYYGMLIDEIKASGADESEYWMYQYCVDNGVSPEVTEDNQWQQVAIREVSDAKIKLRAAEESGSTDPEELESLKNTIAVNMYRLNNGSAINVAESVNFFENGEINLWAVMVVSTQLLTVIGLLMIIVAGSSVSTEFSNGTIKFLLINPVKRWKILIAKYLTCISMGYIMMLLFFAVTMGLSTVMFGASQLGAEYITAVNGEVVTTPGILFIIKDYLLGSISIVVMATLAFALSSMTKSSALAIGASVFAMLSGEGLVTFLKVDLNQDWVRYFVFANMNLATVSNGTSIFSHHTMGFAVTVVAVHMVVFLLMAWDGFTKKEV